VTQPRSQVGIGLLFGRKLERKKRTAFASYGGAKFRDAAQTRSQMKIQQRASAPPKVSAAITEDAQGRKPIRIAKILVPTDFSSASQKALQYAICLANQFGAQLTLLHVIEPPMPAMLAVQSVVPEFFETEMVASEKKLDRLVGSTRAAGIHIVRSSIRAGAPANQILEVANDLDADLIVIATHGFTSWKYFTIGSTAEHVARVAPCPVLVVREKERDFVC